MSKAIILFGVLLFSAVFLTKAIKYGCDVVEVVYAKACLIQTMDQIIRLIKFQQVILKDINVPFQTSICRNNFSNVLTNTYRNVIDAYADVKAYNDKMRNDYSNARLLSYEDNIASLNNFLHEYDVYLIRYDVAKDNLFILNRYLPEYEFVTSKVNFMRDNGIDGTRMQLF